MASRSAAVLGRKPLSPFLYVSTACGPSSGYAKISKMDTGSTEGELYSLGATYAILIGIETYQQQRIDSVQFAEADVAAVKEVLMQNLRVPAENITVWLNSEATKAVFENDLPYMIRQLRPGDRFILFYAGHGFFSNGTNRLTTWDSHPTNLSETTVSLEDVLLAPLKKPPLSPASSLSMPVLQISRQMQFRPETLSAT
jgi:hypothetical protein